HFRHHDGSWRMLEAALHNRLQDADVAAVVASFADLSPQAELEEPFRATFDQAAVGIAHVGEDGRFQLVNRKLCQILGYTREELSAMTVFDVSHAEDRDVTDALRRKMRAHEIDSFSVIKRYVRKNGAAVWVEVTVSLVRAADVVHAHERAAFDRMYVSAAARPGLTHTLRARVRHKDGRYCLVEGTCTDLRAEESVRALVFNYRDVTEREEALARARRLSLMYTALSAANEASAQLNDARQLYQRICDIAVELGGMKLATVRLLDPATRWLET